MPLLPFSISRDGCSSLAKDKGIETENFENGRSLQLSANGKLPLAMMKVALWAALSLGISVVKIIKSSARNPVAC